MTSISLLLSLGVLSSPSTGDPLTTATNRYIADYGRAAAAHAMIPSFSRQTGLACNACHTTFPQLTPFGRMFKLNGYTLTGLQVIRAGDSAKTSLKLDLVPPVSAMLQTSMTNVRTAVPGAQNSTVQLPQELSLFFGEAITPKIGTFLQLTYDPEAGSIGMDNADIRFASHLHLGSRVATVGFTLNNNPTVGDVWNSVPAWGYPYASSSVAPAPGAGTLLDGGLEQQVAGLGAYALFDNHLYGELTLYRSAFQGGPQPPDGSAANAINGVTPYWRLFYETPLGQGTAMVGFLGMNASLYPDGISGLRDRYTDLGFDSQYERPLGTGNLSAHAIYVHESRHLPASLAAGAVDHQDNHLSVVRFDASAYNARRMGLTLGYFRTRGGVDSTAYAPGEVDGYAAGKPNSDGLLGEVSFLPWLNTRFSLQYVKYLAFNGAKTNYDGAGRSAGDNDTLYLLAWLMF